MYNKYDKFKEAIEDANCNMSARVELKVYSGDSDSSSVTLDGIDFIANSLTITEKASSNSDFCVGGCCIGTCDFTLSQQGLKTLSDEGLLKKGTIIKPRFYINNPDDDELSCKLGSFIITGIDSDDYKCQVQSSDYMYLFDKEVTNTDLAEIRAVKKNAKGWLEYCCSKCSTSQVTLGVGDISVTTNIDVEVTLPDDKDVSTFRDLIGWVSIFTASFATIDRNGKLVLRQFQTDDYDYIVPPSSTYLSSKFDMLVTKVAGYNTSVAGFDKCLDDSSVTNCNRVILSIEEIPFLRELHPYDCTELDATVSGYIDNIYNAVKDLKFVGGTVVYSGNPAIELGDTVKVKRIIHQSNSDDYEKESAMMLVTGYTWKFQGSTTINSASITDGVSRKITSSEKKTPSDGTQAVTDVVENLGKSYIDSNGNLVIDCGVYSISEYDLIKRLSGSETSIKLGEKSKNTTITAGLNFVCQPHLDFEADVTFDTGILDSLLNEKFTYEMEDSTSVCRIEWLSVEVNKPSADSSRVVTEVVNYDVKQYGGLAKFKRSTVDTSLNTDSSFNNSCSIDGVKYGSGTGNSTVKNSYKVGLTAWILLKRSTISYQLGTTLTDSTSTKLTDEQKTYITEQIQKAIRFNIKKCVFTIKTQNADMSDLSATEQLAQSISNCASNTDLQVTNETISSLLSRITNLEARIAQLESKQS